MAFLSLQGLTKRYGSIVAAENITLSVERGAFVSLLGPSGCGKTTTLQMIAGFVEATAGRILLDGRDITNIPANTRGLGIVFQSYALFPHMTVAGNVAFGLEMRKIAKGDRDAQVAKALALVKLDQYADRYPRELSGGQRQRVALARALVITPPVLLLDEPLSNLDAKLREEMQFELRRIQQQVGTTTIMVTHDQAEALSISDEVVVMESGRITQQGGPFSLYENPRNAFISSFVGKANLILGKADGGNGVVVAGLRFEPLGKVPTTGDVMLSLRPEKIRLLAEGQGHLSGKVAQRFFMGSQWLYEVETGIGSLTVLTNNDGTQAAEIGNRVSLDWPPTALRALDNEATA